ncbi:MAG: response regulator [Gammaproteobacteria bacterium]|nr:response regulator [Gammaproteobacteria bacterium]
MPTDINSKESFLKELIREGKPSTKKLDQKVLLIDRSGTAVAIISKLISKHAEQVEIVSATTADEALEKLSNGHYNLITISKNMSDMGCGEMINKIRRDMNIKDTPLIVVSGEDSRFPEHEVPPEFINGYFDKKLGQSELARYIQSFLN